MTITRPLITAAFGVLLGFNAANDIIFTAVYGNGIIVGLFLYWLWDE